MNEHCVNNFVELHNTLSRYRNDTRWVFRGQSDVDWKLLPKAGRDSFSGYDDVLTFRAWKRRAYSFVDKVPENNWDWLAIAQHYGIATRLLDWTFNPLAACYFAVRDLPDQDSCIFAYLSERGVYQGKTEPFNINGVFEYRPKGLASRIVNQSSIFTVHGPPNRDLAQYLSTESNLEKIIIHKSYKRELIFELNQYGFNELTLFPDLEGLSNHINWHHLNKEYWSSETDDIS